MKSLKPLEFSQLPESKMLSNAASLQTDSLLGSWRQPRMKDCHSVLGSL